MVRAAADKVHLLIINPQYNFCSKNSSFSVGLSRKMVEFQPAVPVIGANMDFERLGHFIAGSDQTISEITLIFNMLHPNEYEVDQIALMEDKKKLYPLFPLFPWWFCRRRQLMWRYGVNSWVATGILRWQRAGGKLVNHITLGYDTKIDAYAKDQRKYVHYRYQNQKAFDVNRLDQADRILIAGMCSDYQVKLITEEILQSVFAEKVTLLSDCMRPRNMDVEAYVEISKASNALIHRDLDSHNDFLDTISRRGVTTSTAFDFLLMMGAKGAIVSQNRRKEYLAKLRALPFMDALYFVDRYQNVLRSKLNPGNIEMYEIDEAYNDYDGPFYHDARKRVMMLKETAIRIHQGVNTKDISTQSHMKIIRYLKQNHPGFLDKTYEHALLWAYQI